ncbi:TRAP transporter fused permease subunit [Thermanaerosceptrum fracticalcis]|uniref:TRAP transporter fused permease subunit n=1 Tax=Thermanaerosceptrum fracticalcis TaxID=1712410 RepID=A0A7G6DZT2_THEFR|nr:TRAP transporter permease [Thermanaerosceptrum fracticalcis]QNB45336.1 TRAP transporter fused permease subunit [Thermanaerosceptrum fracticalcis]
MSNVTGERTQTEAQVEQVLKNYDTESRFRKFTSHHVTRTVAFMAIALSLFHLYTAWTGPLVTLKHRALHTSVVMALVFLLYPFSKKSAGDKLTVVDILLAILSLATGAYILIDYNGIVLRAGMPNNTDLIFAFITLLLVLEAGRRITGKELAILAVIFLAYAYFGRSLPGNLLSHRGYGIKDILDYMYLTTEGIFGIPIGVSSTYIILFILFGSFLDKSGMGQFFNDLAMALAGTSRGGPAKVAVVSSGFMGSINGSAVANVVTTGCFTIPLMKKVGYRPEFAGAVEAAASVGGQILPPVMGAAAFIMAETLGVPYLKIAIAAAVPAVLYYLGIIMMVHLQACKRGLQGIPKEEVPRVWDVLKSRGHLLLPLVGLVYLLVKGYTPIYAAFYSIVLTVLVSALKKETRMSFRDILKALEDGTRTALGVAMSCAIVGIIVGVATLTGFGLKLASAILLVGQGNLFITLVLTMIACLILGMGLPSIPAYIITATMAAPALAKMGVPPLVSHMFVFYFGMLANLTPPVALAAFAGAGIAGANPTSTGIQSMKLALAGFIVPFVFVYSPSLMLINTTWLDAVMVTITATIGVIALAGAVEGYLLTHANALTRVLLLVGALCMIKPGVITDVVGIVVIAAAVLLQRMEIKKKREITA